MADVVTVVGGVTFHLSEFAHVGDLQWSTGWPYGCLEASWQMDLTPNTFPKALSKDAHVEIWDGPVRVWAGFISETTPGDSWEVHAKGWHAAFTNLLCLNALSTAPSAVPNVAVPAAITRAGLPVVVGSTLSATSITSGTETVANNYVLPFLDAYAESLGQRWAVDENYVLTVAADPTEHYYVLNSDTALRASADDDYVTDIYPRFVATVNATTGDADSWGLGHVGVTAPPAGRRERGMDVTDFGLMTQSASEALAQGQLALNSARMGYTSGFELSAGELLRPGGSPSRPALVKAGRVLRGFTVADASGAVQLGLTQDVLIGRTTYTDGAATVSVLPVGLAPRTFTETLRSMKPKVEYDGTAA